MTGVVRRPPSGVPRAAWARFTLFQQAVYRAACDIPAGQTRSYRWVAERIGRPRAARAVGQALRRNPFAPIVPCHRVVRSDGALGGYAKGPARKRALLQKEGWAVAYGIRHSRRRPHTQGTGCGVPASVA